MSKQGFKAVKNIGFVPIGVNKQSLYKIKNFDK